MKHNPRKDRFNAKILRSLTPEETRSVKGRGGRATGLPLYPAGDDRAGTGLQRLSRSRSPRVWQSAAQNCDQRNWFVTSWWNCTSEALMRVPRALGQRSAWASLSSANLACTSSPITSCMNRLPLNSRMAS